jgi:hypothetical protein
MKRVVSLTAVCVTSTAALTAPAFAGWSVTILTPPGCTASYAYDVSGGQQAGYGYGPATGNHAHAALWTGTAASWVDLNPAGYTESAVCDVSGGQQVGRARGPGTGNQHHAGLWTGTAASWVDLNPAGDTESRALGVSGRRQVGHARGPATENHTHAGLWTGTAASWVDLHSLLPAGYVSSRAYGIDTSSGETWVVGYADDAAGHSQAVKWHYVVPKSSTPVPLLRGPGGLAALIRRR